MGDDRTYQAPIAIRAWSRRRHDADWARAPARAARAHLDRIVNEVRGINRVVYDVSSKPPSTIVWE
jgi:GMP synthase (glutamine-hydrolysing)